MSTPLKLVAFDLDGTLTQHKTPIEPQNRAVLEALSQRVELLEKLLDEKFMEEKKAQENAECRMQNAE